MIKGSYTHCLTASIAAWLRAGTDLKTMTSFTFPWISVRAERMTTPWMPAFLASSG